MLLLATETRFVNNVAKLRSQGSRNAEYSGLGAGLYTDAAYLFLHSVHMGRNNATRDAGVYWLLRASDLSERLSRLARIWLGSNNSTTKMDDLLRIAQCPSLLDATLDATMKLYESYNTTYEQPGTRSPCFTELVPPPMCRTSYEAPQGEAAEVEHPKKLPKVSIFKLKEPT